MKAAVSLVVALTLTACGSFTQPTTFNGRVAFAEGTANALGRTCLNMSKRDQIPVAKLIRCTSTVQEAGNMIDIARSVDVKDRDDRLWAAQRLLETLQKELETP